MTRPTAATGGFPYSHRTVAQIEASRARLADLDALSRIRALTLSESMEMEKLIRRAA